MLPETQIQMRLKRHVARLRNCRRCPLMHPPPVSGGAVLSRVLLVGQAPGVREPLAGKPLPGLRAKRSSAGLRKPPV
jgi:uracil-DNA glycosylase